MERARTEWLRAAGFELDVIQRDMKVVFVVRRVEAYYLASAVLGNLITVTAEPTDVEMCIRDRLRDVQIWIPLIPTRDRHSGALHKFGRINPNS